MKVTLNFFIYFLNIFKIKYKIYMQECLTKKGKKYYLTIKTVPCAVTFKGKNGIVYNIKTYTTAGQYSLISPYYEILIDKDDAILTPEESR